MKEYRLEVWNRTNTTRQAVFGRALSLERHRVLAGEESITIHVDPADPAADQLARGSVLRLQEVGAAAFTLWRYTGSRRARSNEDALTLELEADALWMDFRHGMLRSVQADGRTLTTFGLVGLTPTEWLQEYLLPGYDGEAIAFAVGTVERTDPVSLDFEEASPLEGLQLLEVEAVAEVQFRLNGAGDTYLIDILERVGQTTGAEVRYRKNIRAIQKEEEEAEAVSRMYAHGANGLTLADARWAVASLASNVITFNGEHPVFEDDAFVGFYFYANGTAHQITDSDATAGTITVADATGLNPGDEGWLAVDAQGTQLAYLQSPTAYAELGVRVGLHETDIPNVANLLYNGDLTEWSGGLPVGWSTVGAPTVAELADAVAGRNGGVVAHVTAADTEGLISDAISIAQDAALPYHSILAGLTIVSGQVRMELRHSNGSSYPLEEQAKTTSENAYTALRSYPVSTDPLPTGTAQLAIVAHGGAAEFYLDAALVSRSIGSVEPSFLPGSGAHDLWWETAWELAKASQAKVEYRIDISDLFRVDPDTYPFDALGLGDDVKVRDPAIGQETLRVVEITEDLLSAAATRVSVAADAWSRPNDPYRSQARRRRPKTPGPPNARSSVSVKITGFAFEENTSLAWSAGGVIYRIRVRCAIGPQTFGLAVSQGATDYQDVQITDAQRAAGAADFIILADGLGSEVGFSRESSYDITVTPYSDYSAGVAGVAGTSDTQTARYDQSVPDPTETQHPVSLGYFQANAGSGGVTDHGALTGLGDDDHSQYVHLSTARTVTARHTFNPSTAASPFILGANATGQLVTGLNADQLDGQHGSYYRDAGNLNAGTLLDARVAQSNVTQHEAALSIAWGQITGEPTIPSDLADLSDVIYSAALADGDYLRYNGTLGHWEESEILVGDLPPHTHSWAQVSKTGSSLADLATRSAADLSSGTLLDARVAASNVTQHEAALSIAWTQITGEPAYTTRWPTWTEVTSKPTTFAPSAHSIDGSAHTGTLGLAKGGTGQDWSAVGATYQLVIWNGDSGVLDMLAHPGTADQVLSTTGSGFAWVDAGTVTDVSFAGLSDTTWTTLSDDDIARYNGTLGHWENVDFSTEVNTVIAGASIAWTQITGEPAYTTRWPTISEVTSKASLTPGTGLSGSAYDVTTARTWSVDFAAGYTTYDARYAELSGATFTGAVAFGSTVTGQGGKPIPEIYVVPSGSEPSAASLNDGDIVAVY